MCKYISVVSILQYCSYGAKMTSITSIFIRSMLYKDKKNYPDDKITFNSLLYLDNK